MALSSQAAVFLLSLSILVISAIYAAPQYAWDYVEFSEDTVNLKESVVMAGIAYDTKSRFMCAGFPSLYYGSEVTIACFDTVKYAKGSKPVFDAFPTRADNGLPVSVDEGFLFDNVNVWNTFKSLCRT